MAEEIDNPLESYRDRYRLEFHQAAQEEFQRLLASSHVDARANARSAARIHDLEQRIQSVNGSHGLWSGLATVLVIGVIVGFFFALYGCEANLEPQLFGGGGGAIGALLLLLAWVVPHISRLNTLLATLRKEHDEELAVAWEQMKPLNDRYDWDLTTRLIRRVCPILDFDPYFTAGRLEELEKHFDWSSEFNTDTRSILFSQTGNIVGNPFAFGEYLEQGWATEVYTGTLLIEWTERERGPDGKTYTVTKSEVLVATVEAPKPVYGTRKFLIYGNDAAPELCFTRAPSGLADSGDGWFDNLRKSRELKKLKKLSENLDDDLGYTLMSNHDFELLFHCTDRTDEIQFRLLFTPLAMQQMVALLKDKEHLGYGDCFHFHKCMRCNLILPHQMDDFSLSTDPAIYRHYDLKAAEEFFIAHNCEYFRQIYFSMAPLLCIPLYQQHRSVRTIYGYQPGDESSFWEHEAMANYLGEEHFKNPRSVTTNILKTRRVRRKDSTSTVEVTAHGFRSVRHVEHITKWGGDGRAHSVPVEWFEYLPVEGSADIELCEQHPMQNPGEAERPLAGEQRTNLDEFLEQLHLSRASAAYRRSIFAWLKN